MAKCSPPLLLNKSPTYTDETSSAVVTGASRGIGKAITFDLASRGARVVFTYTSDRSKESAEELISQIKTEARSSAVSVQCNLLDPEAPREILNAAQDAFGSNIDILVNNAAMITDKYIQDITIEHFDEVFHLNVRAPMLMIQTLLPHMRRPGKTCQQRPAVHLLTKANLSRPYYQHWLSGRTWRLPFYRLLRSLESGSRRLHSCLGI